MASIDPPEALRSMNGSVPVPGSGEKQPLGPSIEVAVRVCCDDAPQSDGWIDR